MKQKIEVKVSMTCDECRSKALQTASKIKGVISAAIEGPEKDRVTVVGEDIDTVRLLDKLRKKVGNADIVTVQEIKPPVPPPKEKPVPPPKQDQDKIICYCQPVFHQNPPPYWCPCYHVCDHNPLCTIM